MFKGILIATLTAALIGVPAVTGTEAHRQPLEIAEISGKAAEGVVMPRVDFNSRLQAGGVFPEPTPEPMPEPEQVYETNNGGWQYYGVCTITHYCPCEKCCGQWASGYTASGTLATAYRTCAADLPFGTEVMINGQVWIVEDRGVGGMWIDLFVGDHDLAYQLGIYEADVYIRYPAS